VTTTSEKKTDWISRRTVIDKINAEFSKFDPDYVRNKRLWQAKLGVLSQRLLDIQKNGNPMFRSDQIEIEARWLINYTSEWQFVEKRLDDLWLSLDDMESEDHGTQIQETDGSVARGSTEWIFKLDPTIDYIQQKGTELDHIRPLTFLLPLLNPKKLLATLHRLQISDVARMGRNYRSEFGSIESAMSQLLFKDGELSKFVSDRRLWPNLSNDQIAEKVEELKVTYLEFLRQVQHSRT
jgi:hypothetical protein